MIQIFADGVLAYDSRIAEYAVLKLNITRGIGKGGTAEIVMPEGHPAYNYFLGYRTVVEIYRDGDLRFRGRALYPVDDYYNRRTVMCEGELCFLQDVVDREYFYRAVEPWEIFRYMIQRYNENVEPFKQFKIGTVADFYDHEAIDMENMEPGDTILTQINKLLERCGGYIVFTTDETGARVINWVATVGKYSDQIIDVGENLFNLSKNGMNPDFATAIRPFGVTYRVSADPDSETRRLSLEGSSLAPSGYVVDDAAVAKYGTIMKMVTWDDVVSVEQLYHDAKKYLDKCKIPVTSLELTALDLSYVDASVDSFDLGDYIRVISKPHGLDTYFQLTEQSEDLLDPKNNKITVGKEIKSLTTLGVEGDQNVKKEMQQALTGLKTWVSTGTDQATATIEVEQQSLIEQTKESILLEVSEKYATKTQLGGYATTSFVSSEMALLAGSISLQVSGSLGGNASIKLSVNDEIHEAGLDLSSIRSAFAKDTSVVTINGGKITFNSGTLVINSTNLKVSADGTLSATNAELSGNLTTTSGLYTSKLSSGRLRFFYDGVEYGGIASTYYATDTSKRGIEVRTETGSTFLSFSIYDEEDKTYSPAYIINYGMNPSGHTARHLFYDSANFLGEVFCKYNVYIGNNYCLRTYTADGTVGAQAVWMNNNNYLYFGSTSYPTYVQGSTTHLGSTSTNTRIYGAWIYISSRTFCNNVPIVFSNGYGIQLRDTDGTDYYALTMNSANNVQVGAADHQLRLRGSSVVINSSGATVSSDRRLKNSIEDLGDAYEAVLDKLRPVRFKFNDGTSGRYHAGFIAQEVQEALEAAGLTTQDFGGFVDLNGDGEELGLIYTEFIALLLHKIKRLEQRIAAPEVVQ